MNKLKLTLEEILFVIFWVETEFYCDIPTLMEVIYNLKDDRNFNELLSEVQFNKKLPNPHSDNLEKAFQNLCLKEIIALTRLGEKIIMKRYINFDENFCMSINKIKNKIGSIIETIHLSQEFHVRLKEKVK